MLNEGWYLQVRIHWKWGIKDGTLPSSFPDYCCSDWRHSTGVMLTKIIILKLICSLISTAYDRNKWLWNKVPSNLTHTRRFSRSAYLPVLSFQVTKDQQICWCTTRVQHYRLSFPCSCRQAGGSYTEFHGYFRTLLPVSRLLDFEIQSMPSKKLHLFKNFQCNLSRPSPAKAEAQTLQRTCSMYRRLRVKDRDNWGTANDQTIN